MDNKFDDQSRKMLPPLEHAIAPQRMLTPIQEYEKLPLVTLDEAIVPLIPIVSEVERMVSAVKKCCITPDDDLTIDESASITLYTMESEPQENSVHFILNTTLKSSKPCLIETMVSLSETNYDITRQDPTRIHLPLHLSWCEIGLECSVFHR